MLNGGLKRAILGLAGLLAIAAISAPPVEAQEKVWRNALTLFGTPKYGPDFKHFDYVNVDAPKGGELRLSNEGTFDSFNPLIDKGAPADGIERIYETLLTPSMDEILTSYGLLAEAISFPDDYSSVSFKLRADQMGRDDGSR